MSLFNATQSDWDDWTWQLNNRIDDVQTLGQIFPIPQKELEDIATVSQDYRFAVTPYYLALIDPENPDDPITSVFAINGRDGFRW